MAERRLRAAEHAKARDLFAACVQDLRGADLLAHPKGCLLFGAATGGLIEVDDAERLRGSKLLLEVDERRRALGE
eukprot:955469-Prymnesium_polylepis.1